MKRLLPLLLVAPLAHGGGIPTIDVANIIQSTKTAIENAEQTRSAIVRETQGARQLIQTAQQIEHQVEQIRSMNGNYLKHFLLNDYKYRQARRLIPSTYEKLRSTHEISEETFDRMGVTVSGRERVIDGMAAVRAGDAQIARADSLIDESEELIDAIEADPDTKAALDLANRNAAQSQLAQAELLRAQGVALSTSGRQVIHQELLLTGDRMRSSFGGFFRTGAE